MSDDIKETLTEYLEGKKGDLEWIAILASDKKGEASASMVSANKDYATIIGHLQVMSQILTEQVRKLGKEV